MNYNYSAYPWGRWIKWGAIAIAVLILVTSLVSTYNGLAAAQEDVKVKWSEVENKMQSRLDKIPNLVEVVKGYTKHEEKVFGDIAAARSVLMSGATDIQSKTEADAQLTAAMRNLFVIVENYPELKSSQQFHDLQIAIEGAENRISVARKYFIESVNVYNKKIRTFPSNVFGRLMGFTPMEYYKADPGAGEAPKIQF